MPATVHKTSGDRRIDPAFHRDILEGFSRPQKTASPRWLYDQRGSELFELITILPEYYPTRTERSVLMNNISRVLEHSGVGRAVIEFGSGSSAKTPILLTGLDPSAYVPIDISGDFLRQACDQLADAFPNLPILPIEADFTRPIELPKTLCGVPKIGFFPGSTIGNLDPRDAVDFLRHAAVTLEGGLLLIGIDRRKDPAILVPAYDDSSGTTAAFNINLLHRINRELAGSLPVKAFRHEARWNEAASRIEMHLAAKRDIRFEVDGRPFKMVAGDTIHTENSYKYAPHEGRLLLRSGGWDPIADWSDDSGLFSIYLAKHDLPPPQLRTA